MSLPHFTFVLPSENNEMFNNVLYICYFHYLKRILNDELFKECINSLVLINSKCMLLFQLVAFKICYNKNIVSIGLPKAVAQICSLKSALIRKHSIFIPL